MNYHILNKAIFFLISITALSFNSFSQLIASEPFNYTPGSIVGKNGGTGWGSAWQTTSFNTSNSTVVSPGLGTAISAGAGNTNHQTGTDMRNFRMIDTSNAIFFPYMDYAGDPGATPSTNYLWGRAFGADNTTIWFSMLMRKTVTGASNFGYGGMHLMYGYNLAFDQYGDKKAHQRFQFGLDNNASSFFMSGRTINANPNLPSACGFTVRSTVPATTTPSTIVYRIDFKTGPERVFMWIDPPVNCSVPDTATANIRMSVCDFRFNAVNIGAGAASGTIGYDFDELKIGLTYADVVSCNPLPLHFIATDAVQKNNSALVSWRVADEEDISYYEVEKSIDGSKFYFLDSIRKADKKESGYQFTIKEFYEDAYYRIIAVSKSGRQYISPVRFLRYQSNGKNTILVYPNPAHDYFYLNASIPILAVELRNAAGGLILKYPVGGNFLKGDIRLLPEGLYIIKVSTKKGLFYYRIVKGG